MKTRILVVGFAALSAFAGTAQAGIVSAYGDVDDGGSAIFGETGNFRDGNGGEFKVVVVSGFVGVTGLPADLIGIQPGATFQSFCLETDEFVTLGGTMYNAVVNTEAQLGGSNTDSGDPIDPRTAFLYTEFRMGTLAGYDYTDGSTREANAKSLQEAIWFIEGESGGVNNAFVTLATTAVAPLGSWHTQWGANSIGNVRAMNMSFNGGTIQDLLTIIPLPTAGSLACAGLLGMGLRVRRRSL